MLLLSVSNRRTWHLQNSDYHTYKNTSLDQEDILEYYKSSLSSLNILIDQENDDLPILYWISNLHKTLYRERHMIVPNKNCL